MDYDSNTIILADHSRSKYLYTLTAGLTSPKSYGKHSAVLAAFRQYFIKTGEFDKKWSDDYRVIMENRHTADYELQDDLNKEDALTAIEKSKEFVKEVKKWLQKHNLL